MGRRQGEWNPGTGWREGLSTRQNEGGQSSQITDYLGRAFASLECKQLGNDGDASLK